MTQYIDKSAIITKIEKLKAYLQIPNAQLEAIQVCDNVISVINTLEVKEVDLERAIDKWIDDAAITHEDCGISDVKSTAKHFFELGLKAKGE